MQLSHLYGSSCHLQARCESLVSDMSQPWNKAGEAEAQPRERRQASTGEMMKTVTLKIRRFDPEQDQGPYWAEYRMDVEEKDRLLDALHKVK